jgi:hypothetical protein
MVSKQATAAAMKRLLSTPFFIRLFHWEYWNSRVVYFPLYPYWVWLSIKARSFYFLTAANPKIKNGGFIMESKMDVYQLLPKQFYPETLLFQAGVSIEDVLVAIKRAGIAYPFFAKPDIGERGLGVKMIASGAALKEYVVHMPVPFLIQQMVPYEQEAGVFFCKLPGAEHGMITGIVGKEPVAITGDGQSTLAELVRQNDRYILQWKQIAALYADELDSIVAKGVCKVLVPYGNHSRGSKFTDESFRITPKLNATMNRICDQIPEFYYGRLDIRFDNWQALEEGVDFSIIEVNGSGSEPTHIYDPGHSIFFAWREIMRHWKILYQISKVNNGRGTPYITLAEGRRELNSFREMDALLSVRTW